MQVTVDIPKSKANSIAQYCKMRAHRLCNLAQGSKDMKPSECAMTMVEAKEWERIAKDFETP